MRHFGYALLAALTIDTVSADLTVKCTKGTANIFGLDPYKACDSSCSCVAFELLCLNKPASESEYTLKSYSYDDSSSCSTPECICNTSGIWGIASKQTTGADAYPNPIEVSLPPYNVLKFAANSAASAKKLFDQVENQQKRVSAIVNVPFNENTQDDLPEMLSSTDKTSITDGCTDTVSCDLFYDTKWDYYLSSGAIACADAEAVNPCFGTNACLCTNEYIKVSEKMDLLPGEADFPGNYDLAEKADQILQAHRQKKFASS